MSIKIRSNLGRTFGSTVPYGNQTTLYFEAETNATGAVLGSDADQAAATPTGSVIVLGELPAGLRLDDAQLIVETGMTDDVTGKLGFVYADGVDEDSTEDDAYFLTGVEMKTAGRYDAASAKLPFVLPKPAYLVLTTAAANNAKVSKLGVKVTGVVLGNK